jgi:hypothetical protein
MTLPPGNDSISGSKPTPIFWIRAAIRPAFDSIKFFMSISYIAGPAIAGSCLNNICLNNICLGNHAA